MAGVHRSVAGLEQPADEPVRHREGPDLVNLGRLQQASLDPVVTGDRGRVPELRHPSLVLGEREGARRTEMDVDAGLLGEPFVEADPVVGQMSHRV